MRRSIQDLVSSVDPNVRIEPEVEDVSSSILSFEEEWHSDVPVTPADRRRVHRFGHQFQLSACEAQGR